MLGPQEHRSTIAHPPAVCFGCLPPWLAWLAWLLTDCEPGLGCSEGEREKQESRRGLASNVFLCSQLNVWSCIVNTVGCRFSWQTGPFYCDQSSAVCWKKNTLHCYLSYCSTCCLKLIIKPTAGCLNGILGHVGPSLSWVQQTRSKHGERKGQKRYTTLLLIKVTYSMQCTEHHSLMIYKWVKSV